MFFLHIIATIAVFVFVVFIALRLNVLADKRDDIRFQRLSTIGFFVFLVLAFLLWTLFT